LHRARQMARWRACKKTRPHAQHQTRVARGRVFHARTHAARAQTHLSEYERLSGTTPSGIWSPDTVCCRFLTFFSFFHSSRPPLSVWFFSTEKKKLLLIIIINYNTRLAHLTYPTTTTLYIYIYYIYDNNMAPSGKRLLSSPMTGNVCVCNLLYYFLRTPSRKVRWYCIKTYLPVSRPTDRPTDRPTGRPTRPDTTRPCLVARDGCVLSAYNNINMFVRACGRETTNADGRRRPRRGSL